MQNLVHSYYWDYKAIRQIPKSIGAGDYLYDPHVNGHPLHAKTR